MVGASGGVCGGSSGGMGDGGDSGMCSGTVRRKREDSADFFHTADAAHASRLPVALPPERDWSHKRTGQTAKRRAGGLALSSPVTPPLNEEVIWRQYMGGWGSGVALSPRFSSRIGPASSDAPSVAVNSVSEDVHGVVLPHLLLVPISVSM